jgi:GH35 family endo-1,4-beta-xylanase
MDGVVKGTSFYDERRAGLFWKTVDYFIENDVPFWGIGLGNHLNCVDFVDLSIGTVRESEIDKLRVFIRQAKERGIGVMQTEGDLRLNNFPDWVDQATRLKYQGMVGEALTKALIEEEVEYLGWFGVQDDESWLEDTQWNGPDAKRADSLLLDNGNKKPLYYAVNSACTQKLMQNAV